MKLKASRFFRSLAFALGASLVFASAPFAQAAQYIFVDFNALGDLAADFHETPGGNLVATSTGGLGDSGRVDAHGKSGLYTATSSVALPTETGSSIVVSMFVTEDICATYFNLGFVATSTPGVDGSFGQPTSSPYLGATFDCDSSLFMKDGSNIGDWVEFPDMELGGAAWYQVMFALTASSTEDTYDLTYRVYEADDEGNVGRALADGVSYGVEHTTIDDPSGFVHPYFSAQSGELISVDNFAVTNELPPLFTSGTGTEGNPFVITSCIELQHMDISEQKLEAHYVLGSDIACGEGAADGNDTTEWNGGEGFVPIGTVTGLDGKWGDFVGTLDGNYNTITGLTINRSGSGSQGLFRTIGPFAEVRNLILEDFSVNGNDDVGALAGTAYGLIERVGVIDPHINAGGDAGGLAGILDGGDVYESYVVGGSVNADDGDAGGLAAYANDEYIENSYAKTTVSGFYGTAGFLGAVLNSEIVNSFSAGSVTHLGGSDLLAGFAGGQYGDGFTITGSFTTSALSGDAQYKGGFVGKWGDSMDDVGGASNYFFNSMDACEGTDKDLSALCTKAASADYFKDIANEPYSLWDIEETETYDENGGYPFLAWQVLGAETGEAVWFITPFGSEQEETSPRRPGGSYVNRTTPPITTDGSIPDVIRNIILNNRALFLQAHSLGIQLPQFILELLGLAPAGAVRDLDLGLEGTDVTALQTLLIAEGYPIPAGPTGFFGPQTQSALAAYQRDHGISPSIGYFGPITRAEMKNRGLGGLWW